MAADVGGKVWADQVAGPLLDLEPVVAASLVAVEGSCPGTKDERSWEKGYFRFFLGKINTHLCTLGPCRTLPLQHLLKSTQFVLSRGHKTCSLPFLSSSEGS